uniref:NADH-ubiquinone oxidoreductase chain 6 n=1 Tax=Lasiopodomys mandarinus TaxID=399234 RepID=A0A0A6Z5Q0_9RODE|nr:NADH dehydrogenase subunit 6 [Lasiopodomys mandarinus]AFL55726.1 NADH dehydrogenase subunit 6 [Lasiopodomys mandarinus]AHG30931.1 NADH dehydrogenase subunit 6 [Lasiopodomys mandarinus]QRV60542.1 NADH dehydrogenase subunit 6 [Lasiopodomys mandarinus]QRV60555.1 NADH dehydrogenase subunit 6 [Lasiopodomys mandarinus]QRV60568.1 NADH dehydrogenase subunit 6 [Lasiopodomys mandarinus]
MTELIYILSSVIALGCLGASLKPSPIYGGLCLIVSGCSGCLAVLGFGGSFLGLMVFLVYLGGMLVVFGYTTAMSAEDYPEALVSSWLTIGILFMSVFMEVSVVLMSDYYEGVGVLVEFSSMGGWVVYDADGLGYMGEGGVGVAALYGCSAWLMVVSGWTLFMGVLIIIEITRGN